jgi:hypothetical protein
MDLLGTNPAEPEDTAEEMLPDEPTVPTFVGINLYGVQVRDGDNYGDDDESLEVSHSELDSTAVIAQIGESGHVDSVVEVLRIHEPAADASDGVEVNVHDEVPGLGNPNHGIIQEGSNVDPHQDPASEGAKGDINDPIPIPMVEGSDDALLVDPLPSRFPGDGDPDDGFSYFDGPNPNDIPVDKFHLAVLTFMTSCDLSQAMYQAFREIMAFATPQSIQTLPETLVTLRSRARRNMPVMRLRGYEVSIDGTKVPPKSDIPQRGYRFEIQEYAKRWLADERMMKSMHFGLGYLPSDIAPRREFYQGDAWLGSIRTTSGEFAYLNGDPDPLLPSDCVSYIPRDSDTGRRVFIQVFGIGFLGHPDDGIPHSEKQHGVLGRRLLPHAELPMPWIWNDNIAEFTRTLEESEHAANLHFVLGLSALPELVLMEDDRIVIPLDQLDQKEWVYFLDHPSVDELQDSLLPVNPTHCVRHIAYSCNGPKIRSVHQRHRIPAETELLDMGRQHCLETFVGPGRFSLPVTLFLDAFGLHRNVYHQLQGLYIQPANMDAPARFTMQNCFVLMLGPFGGNDSDIAQCLTNETVALGRGIRANILCANGEQHTNAVLTVFPLCMTGDMPQQNHNVGVMSPAAKFNCRYCFTGDRGNLSVDVKAEGRYQTAHSNLRSQLDLVRGKRNKAEAFSRCGMNESEGPIFARCFPCLDIFNGFPNDPFHCELRLAKYFQEALINGLFSDDGKDAYGEVWNQVDVPYGWSVS